MVTEIKDRDNLTCVICGFTGKGVSEHDRYDRVLKRDSTAPICDNADACMDRAGWYRRKLEFKKGGN